MFAWFPNFLVIKNTVPSPAFSRIMSTDIRLLARIGVVGITAVCESLHGIDVQALSV